MNDTRQLSVTHDEADLMLNAVMLEESRLRALPPVSDESEFADYYRQERQRLIANAEAIREKLCRDE